MPLEIAVLLLPRFSLMALSAVLEPFRIANRLAGRDLYHWRFVSPEAGRVEASSGLPITAELSVRDPITAQRVIVCTSFEPMAAAGRDVLRWLRRLDSQGAELWAVDTGAFLLAEAGLLAGRTVTLHWESIAAFAELYGKVETRRSLFERSGRVATCAGGTAGIDLALTAIAAEHGSSLALDIADQLIHQGIRDAAGTAAGGADAALRDAQPDGAGGDRPAAALDRAAAVAGTGGSRAGRVAAPAAAPVRDPPRPLIQALRPGAAAGAGKGADWRQTGLGLILDVAVARGYRFS